MKKFYFFETCEIKINAGGFSRRLISALLEISDPTAVTDWQVGILGRPVSCFSCSFSNRIHLPFQIT